MATIAEKPHLWFVARTAEIAEERRAGSVAARADIAEMAMVLAQRVGE